MIVFAGAWALQNNNDARKNMLLVASYVFYGWWDWRFCFLLLAASLTAWIAGLALHVTTDETRKKWITGTACAVLLGVLAFFKYYGFFLSSLQDALFAVGWQRDLPFMEIILPVGISFFTFQAISYVVDVHREQIGARRSPRDVLLYISLFPQLVAGPIVRAADFLPQLEQRATLTRAASMFGLTLCGVGLFKKMVVANYLATSLVDPVFIDPSSQSSLMLLTAVYGYAIQIYCDFSGYSDIAIGTAALLGFRFKANFNQPYRATTLQDFWRRWHISLSGWLRDYLYIPLGGSRFGTWFTYRNLLITMVLGGFWHGAAWNFIIWGTMHGLWLAAERASGLANFFNRNRIGRVTGWFVTFHLVCAAWVFFRAENLDLALDWFSGLAAFSLPVYGLTWLATLLIVVSLAFQFTPSDGVNRVAGYFERKPLILAGGIFALTLLAVQWLAPSGTAPFIYFQF